MDWPTALIAVGYCVAVLVTCIFVLALLKVGRSDDD